MHHISKNWEHVFDFQYKVVIGQCVFLLKVVEKKLPAAAQAFNRTSYENVVCPLPKRKRQKKRHFPLVIWSDEYHGASI